ncbi:MAG: metal-dependent hydrolase [Pseudomonadota bacterium]
MDPVTYAVAGIALAVTLEVRGGGPLPAHLDRTLVVAALAGMSPDIDSFDKPFGRGNEGLSYMLYHRGVVHSFVGCLALSAVIVAVVWLFSRKGASLGRLLLIGFLCASLHLVMDATNDYGVHPFWPFWNGWLYGDFIFLLEPLVIMSLLPLALRGIMRDRGSRRANLRQLGLVVLALLAILLLIWYRVATGVYIGWISATFATCYLLTQLVLACWRRNYAPIAWASLLAVWGVFFVSSRCAKAVTVSALEASTWGERLVQVDTTPAATTPLCWNVTTAGLDSSSGQIITRMGTLSLVPSLMPPCECRTATPHGPPTFEPNGDQTPCKTPPGAAWYWTAHEEASVEELRKLARRNCRVEAALHFLRTPALKVEAKGGQVLIGDLRLDYSRDLAKYCKYRFDELEIPSCRSPSPWIPPFFDPGSGGPAMELH